MAAARRRPPGCRTAPGMARRLARRAGRQPGRTIASVGPNASTTPGAAVRKLQADVAVLGECEEILPRLAGPREAWADVPSIAYVDLTGTLRSQGPTHASDMSALPSLT